jgi:hypothetical protein
MRVELVDGVVARIVES